MPFLRLGLISALLWMASAYATATDRIDAVSTRNFEDTVQQLKWAFGGYGMTTVVAIDYQQILKKMRVESGPAVVIEVMRAEWARLLLQEDVALGIALPARVYVFQRPDGTIMVTYQRPGAALDTHESTAVRDFAEQLDEKLLAIVKQATTKSTPAN